MCRASTDACSEEGTRVGRARASGRKTRTGGGLAVIDFKDSGDGGRLSMGWFIMLGSSTGIV